MDTFVCNLCFASLSSTRFKCMCCNDFDVCENCLMNSDLHDQSHIFIKIKSEEAPVFSIDSEYPQPSVLEELAVLDSLAIFNLDVDAISMQLGLPVQTVKSIIIQMLNSSQEQEQQQENSCPELLYPDSGVVDKEEISFETVVWPPSQSSELYTLWNILAELSVDDYLSASTLELSAYDEWIRLREETKEYNVHVLLRSKNLGVRLSREPMLQKHLLKTIGFAIPGTSRAVSAKRTALKQALHKQSRSRILSTTADIATFAFQTHFMSGSARNRVDKHQHRSSPSHSRNIGRSQQKYSGSRKGKVRRLPEQQSVYYAVDSDNEKSCSTGHSNLKDDSISPHSSCNEKTSCRLSNRLANIITPEHPQERLALSSPRRHFPTLAIEIARAEEEHTDASTGVDQLSPHEQNLVYIQQSIEMFCETPEHSEEDLILQDNACEHFPVKRYVSAEVKCLSLVTYKPLNWHNIPALLVIPVLVKETTPFKRTLLVATLLPALRAITPLHAAITKRISRELVVVLAAGFPLHAGAIDSKLPGQSVCIKRKVSANDFPQNSKQKKRVRFNFTASMQYKRWKSGRCAEFCLETALQESEGNNMITTLIGADTRYGEDILDNTLLASNLGADPFIHRKSTSSSSRTSPRDFPCSKQVIELSGEALVDSISTSRGSAKEVIDNLSECLPSILKKRSAFDTNNTLSSSKRVRFTEDVCIESKIRSGMYLTPRQRSSSSSASSNLLLGKQYLPKITKQGYHLTKSSSTVNPWWIDEVAGTEQSLGLNMNEELSQEVLVDTESDTDSASSSVELNINSSPQAHEDWNVPPYDSDAVGVHEQSEPNVGAAPINIMMEGADITSAQVSDKKLPTAPNRNPISPIAVTVKTDWWEEELFKDAPSTDVA